MTNLKPCPCGKTPTRVYNIEGNLYGDCCNRWGVHRYTEEDWTAAWNAAPRAVPIPCPSECDHGRLPDFLDSMTFEEFMAALENGEEVPTIPCPTCAPFGGRGAIMVEEDHQQQEG